MDYAFLLLQHFLERIFAGVDELRVESFDFLLEKLLLLSFFEKLMRFFVEGLDDLVLILLDPLLLLLQLHQLGLVDQHLVLLIELRSQLVEFFLVFSNQGFLVQILVDQRLVLDALGPISKFQRRERLQEGLRGRRYHS